LVIKLAHDQHFTLTFEMQALCHFLFISSISLSLSPLIEVNAQDEEGNTRNIISSLIFLKHGC
jgi:hypothetical protein